MTSQLPLPFDACQLARRGDAATSQAAARASATLRARHHHAILESLEQGPGTAHEIAARLDGVTAVQVCRRLAELERRGHVHATGETRPTPTGRESRVFGLRPREVPTC